MGRPRGRGLRAVCAENALELNSPGYHRVMSHSPRIVVCGKSVFLTAVEAGLTALPGVQVDRLNPHLPGLAARIEALAPDAVLVEWNGRCGELAFRLLDRGLPVIALDANKDTITVLGGRQIEASSAADLIQVIAQVNQRQVE